jgi:hypothetical protein
MSLPLFEENKKADKAFVVFLLLIFLLVNFPLIIGRYTCVYDALSYFRPHYRLIADFARQGKLVFWNPWLTGGFPEYLTPQTGVLSPLTFLFSLITGPGSRGFIVYWLALWFMGGLSLYGLARWLKAPPWGAFITSLGFLVSGFYTGHAGHTSWIYTFSFFPLFLWRWDVFLVTRRLLVALQAGIIWGTSAVGGYPGIFLILSGYTLLWTTGRCAFFNIPEIKFSYKNISTYLFGFLLFLLIILLISGPTYFSLLSEGRGFTDRSGPIPRDEAVYANSLQPTALGTLASPLLTFFGNYSTDISSRSIFISPICLVFAIFALLNGRSKKFILWILGLSFLFIGIALGQTFPLRGWLYDLFPPMRYFRHSAMFRGPFIFSIVCLSIIGFRDFSRKAFPDFSLPVKNLFFSGWITLLITGSLYLVMNLKYLLTNDFYLKTNLWVAHTHLIIVWTSLLVIPYLFYRSKKYHYIPILLVMISIADFFFAAYLSSSTVMQPMDQELRALDAKYSTSLDLSAKGLERSHGLGRSQEVNNIIGLSEKIPCLDSYSDLANQFFTLMNQDPILVEMATGKDRIWFTENPVVIPPSLKVFETFSHQIHKLNQPVIIIHARQDMEADKYTPSIRKEQVNKIYNLPPAQKVVARMITYKPEKLIFDVDCPTKGWLLVTDRYAKSWQVTVNGLPSTIWGGNFVYRAIPVEAGNQKIAFTYKPFGILPMTLLGWGAILLIILITFFQWFLRKSDGEGKSSFYCSRF